MQSKQLIVFPTSRAIRNYVTEHSMNGFLPYLLTIQDFFKKAIHIDDLKYIDDEHRLLLLKESTHIKNFSQLGISNQFNDFMKQSDYIFRFFNEISAEQVDIKDIKTADTYEFYEEHLTLLGQILTNYKQLLTKYGYVDQVNIQEFYKINRDYLQQFEKIEIVFEGYFTNFEYQLIKEIATVCQLTINLTTNEYNKKAFEKFKDLGFELEEGYSYSLDITNQTIIQKTQQQKIQQGIKVEGFRSRINQIAFIKQEITQLTKNGLDASDIVVVVPDESFVEVLQEFDEEGYFNYAMGKKITNSEIFIRMNALYGYLNESELKDSEYINYIKVYEKETVEYLQNEFTQTLSEESFEKLIAFIQKDEENEELIQKYEESIYKLKKLLFAYEEELSLKEAFRFIIQRISEVTLDDVNSGPVTVMGVLETRAISYKAVIIIDFNEDNVPKKSVKDKFLSSNIKKYANLPTLKDRENLQKFYYTQLCKNALELRVSYVKSESTQISRFAKELFNVTVSDETSDEKYSHILFSQKKFKHFSDEIVLDIDLSKQKWSATSLKTYLQCKRRYYLNYIANIKEHHFSLKPQGFELGSIIHAILEEFYQKNRRIDETMNDDILLKEVMKHQNKNSFLTLELEIWKSYLQKFIQKEKELFKNKKQTIHTELKFSIEYCNVNLIGSIDRVDKYDNEERYDIIDYKTGSSLKVDTIKNYEKSVDFQLEFYYLALRTLLKHDNLDATPLYYDLKNTQLIVESVLNEKLLLLEKILEELKTTHVNFEKCSEKSICQYCPYTTICNR